MSAQTFRVCGIPAKVTIDTLPRFLHESIDGLDNLENIRARSLAPAPEYWSTRPELRRQVATLEFTALPEWAKDRTKSLWTLPIRGGDTSLVFDREFLGITPLNDVKALDYSYDCIAIPGLSSHPFGSWRQRETSTDGQFMWLRDQLPHDLPGLRVMLYGYDSKLGGSESFQSIHDIVGTFIEVLRAIGCGHYSSKPIILLAHSLGGIVVKQAIYTLAGLQDTILGNIKMILFLGVPNKGMLTQHLFALVQGQPNEDMIRMLSHDSDYLMQLDTLFSGVLKYYNLRVISGYETQLSPTAMINASGKIEMTGKSEKLVSRESAIQSSSRNPQDIFAINQNHSNMVKFPPGDAVYLAVRNHLEQIANQRENVNTVEKKPDSIPSAGPSHTAPDTNGIHYNPIPADQFGFSAQQSSPAQSSDIRSAMFPARSSQAYKLTNSARDIQEMIKSLKFEEQYTRLEIIESAQESTFAWTLENKELGFIDWIHHGKRFYWIQGKPGSGKSTMMKFLHENADLKDLLMTSRLKLPQIDLWFFFNDRGSPLQKSLDGLLRSILSEIVIRDNRMAALILDVFIHKRDEKRADWTMDDLNRALSAVLQQDLYDVELVLFLDALDEYKGIPEVLSTWLIDIVDQSNQHTSGTRVKICFSSRPWNAFVKTFGHERDFAIHDHTTADIEQYVLARLSDKWTEESIAKPEMKWISENKQNLVENVTQRAEGVFLWVKLALDELFLSSPPQSLERLEAVIGSFPQELEKFYVRTLDRMPYNNRYKAYVLLELVLRNQSIPKGLERLLCAASCAPGRSFQECRKLYTQAKEERQKLPEAMGEIDICGGLLECKQTNATDQTYVVQFIHQTVRDFVGSPRFIQRILKRHRLLLVENGYTFWFKYYLVAFAGTPYNLDNLFELAHEDEMTTGRPATTLIESIPFSSAIHSSGVIHCPSSFIFGVLADLRLYVQLRHDRDSSCLAAECNPISALAMSVVEGYDNRPLNLTEMCRLLIAKGWAINDDRWFNLTPFETLFCHGMRGRARSFERQVSEERVGIAQLLITEGGQDPNIRIRRMHQMSRYPSRYPMIMIMKAEWSAIHISIGAMLRMLLENGADPNAQDKHGKTALDVVFETTADVEFEEDLVSEVLYMISRGCGITRHGARRLPNFLNSVREARAIQGRQSEDLFAELENRLTLNLKVSTNSIWKYRSSSERNQVTILSEEPFAMATATTTTVVKPKALSRFKQNVLESFRIKRNS